MKKEIESIFFSLLKTDKNRAFKLVFDAYWFPLYNQAYKKVQCKDLAKDLVQEAFVTLWNKIELLDGEGCVLAYLYAILRNKILQFFEKDRIRLSHANSLSVKLLVVDNYSQHMLLEKELQQLINAELVRMPTRMREIYVLKKEDQLSIKEIAAHFSLSEQTIKNQLQMAYQRLRNLISYYENALAVFYIAVILMNYW